MDAWMGRKVYHESGEYMGRVVFVAWHPRGGVAGLTTDCDTPGISPPTRFVVFWNRTQLRFESRMLRGIFHLGSELNE